MLNNYVAVILSLIIVSCANTPLKPEKIKGSFEKKIRRSHQNVGIKTKWRAKVDEFRTYCFESMSMTSS